MFQISKTYYRLKISPPTPTLCSLLLVFCVFFQVFICKYKHEQLLDGAFMVW